MGVLPGITPATVSLHNCVVARNSAIAGQGGGGGARVGEGGGLFINLWDLEKRYALADMRAATDFTYACSPLRFTPNGRMVVMGCFQLTTEHEKLAQAGTLVVCGDAGPGLGDSIYEAVIYVRGQLHGLGADAQEEPMQPADFAGLGALLDRAGFDHDPRTFKRVASARQLYHWHADADPSHYS